MEGKGDWFPQASTENLPKTISGGLNKDRGQRSVTPAIFLSTGDERRCRWPLNTETAWTPCSTGRAWDSRACLSGDPPPTGTEGIGRTSGMPWKVHLTAKEGQSRSPGMTEPEGVAVDWAWRTKGAGHPRICNRRRKQGLWIWKEQVSNY